MPGRALIISCNDYTLMDPSGRANLNGCLNDGADYYRLFKWKGFDEIRWLKDKEATAQAIEDGCRWLQEGTWVQQRGDGTLGPITDVSERGVSVRAHRAFAYSGHGTLYKGRPALCPADLNQSWSNALSYAKLAPLLAFPEGTMFFASIDACHSGERIRHAPNNHQLPFGEDAPKPRFLPPPIEQLPFGTEIGEDRVAPLADSWRHLCSSEIDVVITGCRSNQTSADAWIGKAYHGAFTYAVMRILEETQTDISYIDLIKRAVAYMEREGYDQRPCYVGPKEYEGVKFMVPPRVTLLDGKPDAQ